ncbi:hypothetical protein CPB83DRAFT_845366 [Crepidotus variabilis]|uniref:SRR1-like domain-containing protein n=1 Tax=Crepidotus variabilis TaxID=179855 RepID=A0A9P6ERA8_9AGAR|nr:hypothetical protein CPB83DRAFT_845366 [Crepidotus variabilis]
MTDRSRNNKPASSLPPPTASGSFTYSDFTTRKKKRNNKHQVSRTAPQTLSSSLPPLREKLLGEGEWFANCSRILSDAWKEFCATTTPTEQEPSTKCKSDVVGLLCLGLGSPSASLNARVQLAFLTEACKILDIALDLGLIYDPVFAEEDIAYFKTLQMKVLEPSDHTNDAHLNLNGPMVCFMPHCDMELYEALLRVNAGDKSQDSGKRSDNESSLENVFLIGNSLQAYLDNKPSSVLKTKSPNLLQFGERHSFTSLLFYLCFRHRNSSKYLLLLKNSPNTNV